MAVYSLLVQSIDLLRFCGSAGGTNIVRDRIDRFSAPPGEKDLGPLARKGARDGTAIIITKTPLIAMISWEAPGSFPLRVPGG